MPRPTFSRIGSEKRQRPGEGTSGTPPAAPPSADPPPAQRSAIEPTTPRDVARRLLERAATLDERGTAVRTAHDMGMTLAEIEAYLDWLEVHRPPDESGDRTTPA